MSAVVRVALQPQRRFDIPHSTYYPCSVLVVRWPPAATQRLQTLSSGREATSSTSLLASARWYFRVGRTRHAASTGCCVHDQAASGRQPHRAQQRDRQATAAAGRRAATRVVRAPVSAVTATTHPGCTEQHEQQQQQQSYADNWRRVELLATSTDLPRAVSIARRNGCRRRR